MCGLHALNSLIQSEFGPRFGKADLDAICLELDPPRCCHINRHRHWAGLGDYDVNVLLYALSGRGLDGTWFDSRQSASRLRDQLGEPGIVGLLVNGAGSGGMLSGLGGDNHWFTMRVIREVWWDLNSLNRAPRRYVDVGEMCNDLQSVLDGGGNIIVVRDTAKRADATLSSGVGAGGDAMTGRAKPSVPTHSLSGLPVGGGSIASTAAAAAAAAPMNGRTARGASITGAGATGPSSVRSNSVTNGGGGSGSSSSSNGGRGTVVHVASPVAKGRASTSVTAAAAAPASASQSALSRAVSWGSGAISPNGVGAATAPVGSLRVRVSNASAPSSSVASILPPVGAFSASSTSVSDRRLSSSAAASTGAAQRGGSGSSGGGGSTILDTALRSGHAVLPAPLPSSAAAASATVATATSSGASGGTGNTIGGTVGVISSGSSSSNGSKRLHLPSLYSLATAQLADVDAAAVPNGTTSLSSPVQLRDATRPSSSTDAQLLLQPVWGPRPP